MTELLATSALEPPNLTVPVPTFCSDDVAKLLTEFEHIRGQLLVLSEADQTGATPRELSGQLRAIARQVLDWSVFLIGEELAAVCDNAVRHLERQPERDDVRQELAARMIERLRNLAEGSIDNLDGYAFLSARHLLAALRRRENRKKPLSAIPGGEESLAVWPEISVDSGEEEVEAFCKYLDQQAQPNSVLPMSQILRVYRSHSHDRVATAKYLNITASELRNHLAAIMKLAKSWSR